MSFSQEHGQKKWLVCKGEIERSASEKMEIRYNLKR